jgi:hypothetical protein
MSKTLIIPETIEISGGKFVRVQNANEIIAEQGYWNDNLIEFSRNEEFINWRFFYNKNRYFIYKYSCDVKSENRKPVYFISRQIIWRKVNCLLIVDFRYSIDEIEMLRKIVQASGLLAKKLKMAATIVGSSLPICNSYFRRQKFIRIGDRSVIVTKFMKNNEDLENSENRIFVTFADSDREKW